MQPNYIMKRLSVSTTTRKVEREDTPTPTKKRMAKPSLAKLRKLGYTPQQASRILDAY